MQRLLITLVLVGAPRAAWACPVCFGQSDSPLALGTNMAVFFMLGITGSVLTGFASFIFYLMRRARLAEESGPADAGRYVGESGPAEAGRYVLDEKGSA